MRRWEKFILDGQRIGGLWREYSELSLTTRVAFRPERTSLPYCAESVIRFEPDGGSWAHYRFTQEPDGQRTEITRAEAGLGQDSLPSYGEYMVLLDLIGTGVPSRSYLRLQDSDPGRSALTVMRRAGREFLPDGSGEAERVEVVEDGATVGVHWIRDAALVRSDWNGPVSSPAERDAVLAGLGQELVDFLVAQER